MWPTSRGDRTLGGTEAVLVAQAIAAMLDLIVEQIEDPWEGEETDPEPTLHAALHTGISLYDGLNLGQRLAVLHQTARHLLTPIDIPDRQLAAIDDATVAAIFAEIRDRIEIEADYLTPEATATGVDSDPNASRWRRWVLATCHEVLGSGEWDAFSAGQAYRSVPLAQWEDWIDCLASAILWDRDFEFADSFLDADPDSARIRRRALGIDDDYFVYPAPDPTPAQVDRLIRQTRNLLRPFGVYREDDPPLSDAEPD